MDKPYVLVLKGSPRRGGNSAVLANQVEAGAREAGGEVETLLLDRMKIAPCDGCDACHNKIPGVCILKDDMDGLYERLPRAHALVIASPIYFFTVNAQTKLFLDRMYVYDAIPNPLPELKKVGIVLVYGDDDVATSGVMNAIHMYQDIFRYYQKPITGVVHGSANKAGEVRTNEELMQKAFELGKLMAE